MLFGLFGSSQPKETGPSASSAPSSSSSTPPPPPPHDQLLTDAEAEQQQMAFEPEGLAKVTSTNAPSENDAVADNTGLKQDGQSDALVSESVQRQWEEFKAQPGTQEITRELSNFPIYIGLGAVPGAMGAGWLMKRSNRTPSTAVTAIAVLCGGFVGASIAMQWGLWKVKRTWHRVDPDRSLYRRFKELVELTKAE